ncbi:hypothetical protein RUND412_007209 [Rhizina undulata]
MAIPTEIFPAEELPHRLQTDVVTKRRRKVPVEDLSKCQLLELVQWDCQASRDHIRCWPIERLFRRCKDVTVEVTAFEGAGRVGSGLID